tara:strand:+ start:448 stop:555 length:108 start_codon:yes stop_codon:yes gene_type:complete
MTKPTQIKIGGIPIENIAIGVTSLTLVAIILIIMR